MNGWDVLVIFAVGAVASFVMAESKFWLIWWMERRQHKGGER